MYDEDGREIRLLEVDAAAAARHDPDVAAGLASFYRERHERITRRDGGRSRSRYRGVARRGVSPAGIGMKESTGLPLPDDDRLHATLARGLLRRRTTLSNGGPPMITVDFRSRFEGDAVALDLDTFLDEHLPPLLDKRTVEAGRAATDSVSRR